MRSVDLPYGWCGPLVLDDADHFTQINLPEWKEVSDLQDPAYYFDHPVAGRALRKLINGAGPAAKVLLIADDLTRTTPQQVIISALLAYLDGLGIERAAVSVLVASGLHRKMTAEECAARYGDDALQGVRVFVHNAFDGDSLECRNLASGMRVKLNRLVFACDVRIGIGQIGPHRIAGFSGGGKIIMPGISDPDSIADLHWKGWLTEGDQLYGIVENPVRSVIEEAADAVQLDFIVNVVLDGRERIRGWFCGEHRAAFRSGCVKAADYFRVTVPRSDIVVVDSSPYDVDIWQACKAVSVAEIAVARGGVIILVTPCPEGLSSHSNEISKVGYRTMSEIVRLVESKAIDVFIGCHLMVFARIIEQGTVFIVTPPANFDEFTAAGLTCLATVAEALEAARAKMEGEDPRILYLHEAARLLLEVVE